MTTPEPSSAALIADLIEAGMSRRAIGRSIGRNDRLIGQVLGGAKPGANLRASLADLQARVQRLGAANIPQVPVVTPPRRTTRTGATAKVRRPTTVASGDSYSTAQTKAQASRSGAKGLLGVLQRALDNGETEYAADVEVARIPAGAASKSGPARGAESRPVLTARGHTADLLYLARECGSVTGALLIELGCDEDEALDGGLQDDVLGVEMRTWRPR